MKAKASYAVLGLLLVAGMAIAVQRLSSTADSQITRVRADEQSITLAERLRWNSERIVADGRGYLISGDPALLAQVEQAERRFDENVRTLRSRTHGRGDEELVGKSESAARDFRRVQEELIAARRPTEAVPLISRFERDLLPLRRQLEDSLTELVAHKEAALQAEYEIAAAERARVERWLYGLLGVLVAVELVVASYFARLLGRSYEKERSALAAARRALQARDDMMGMVAHDLRNPLNAIMMRAALMRDVPDPKGTRAHAESILKVVTRMAHMIRSMLDVATIEAGRFPVVPRTCSVGELLDETMEMLAGLAASKQIRLEQEVKDAALLVRADRERVLQVLSNLVGNALKFTPSGGRVVLSVDRDEMNVRFRVIDTGPGILREHLPHLFDRFWKDESTGKKGTGLGLFIAKGIIEAHEGELWAECEPGRGARFCFTLPIAAEPAMATGPATAQGQGGMSLPTAHSHS